MLEIKKYQTQELGLSKVNFSNKMFQYRVKITDEDVNTLAESIKNNGQETPVVVWQRTSGELVLICGYRRFTAVKLLGLNEITAIVIPESDLPYEQAVQLSLDENIQRKSYVENDYILIATKLSSEGLTIRQIAEKIAKGHGFKLFNYGKAV